MTFVLVGIGYQNRDTGGSELLSKKIDYEIAPQIGDDIEVAPEVRREDGVLQFSSWHSTVNHRWIHTSNEVAIEVRCNSPRGKLDADDEAFLRKHGFS